MSALFLLVGIQVVSVASLFLWVAVLFIKDR